MLKIKDESKWQEIATTKTQRELRKANGLTEEPIVNCLRLKGFRVDLFPTLIIEPILAYCDEAGDNINGTEQFVLKGEEAEQFADKNKLDVFVKHLEELVIESSKPEHDELKKIGHALKLECEVLNK
jgi:hypothetical protein